MITPATQCPKCQSTNVLAVLYGWPSPEEEMQVASGQATYGGSRPFDLMPTHRCADCLKWFRHDGLGYSKEPVHACHYCAAELKYFEIREFQDDAQRHSESNVANHPLPMCSDCAREVYELEAEQQIETDEQDTSRKRLHVFLLCGLVLCIVIFITFIAGAATWMTRS